MHIDQTNNSYIFPGLALGIVSSCARHVSDGMIKAAARTLAELSPTRKDKGASLLPDIRTIRYVSSQIARAVSIQAVQDSVAGIGPNEIDDAIAANIWEPVYRPYEPADE